MTNAEARGLFNALVLIHDQALKIMEHFSILSIQYYNFRVKDNPNYYSNVPRLLAERLDQRMIETRSVIASFNKQKVDFFKLTGKGLANISLVEGVGTDFLEGVGYARAALRELRIECDKGIGMLEETIDSIPAAEKNKLEDLRKELKKLSEKVADINFEKNIETAIDECEKGHYLASCLIAGRVVSHIVDQIDDGGNKEDKIKHKIEYLKQSGVVPKDRRDITEAIIKADKEARNFSTHSISVFPQPSDAYSLLAGSLRLLEIWVKLQETK